MEKERAGNLVDFGLLYHRCNVASLLARLEGKVATTRVIAKMSNDRPEEKQNRITITAIKPLTNEGLLQYVDTHGIPRDIVKQYCQEVHYTNSGKPYFALGFKNVSGGYELRSKYFKGSSAPKDITHIKNANASLAVFEGFFNFLSFQTQHKNRLPQATDFLILNSLSFFEKTRPIMESYKQANLLFGQ